MTVASIPDDCSASKNGDELLGLRSVLAALECAKQKNRERYLLLLQSEKCNQNSGSVHYEVILPEILSQKKQFFFQR